MTEKIIEATSVEGVINLFGNFDSNLKLIERELGVQIVNRDNLIKISGDNSPLAEELISGLLELSEKGEVINEQIIRSMLAAILENSAETFTCLK